MHRLIRRCLFPTFRACRRFSSFLAPEQVLKQVCFKPNQEAEGAICVIPVPFTTKVAEATGEATITVDHTKMIRYMVLPQLTRPGVIHTVGCGLAAYDCSVEEYASQGA